MYMTSESLKDLLRGAIDHHRDNRDADAMALAAIAQGYALVSIAESLARMTSPATIEEALSMYFKHIDEQLKAPA